MNTQKRAKMHMPSRWIALVLCLVITVSGLVLQAEAQTEYGDVNGDQAINATDALLVLKFAVSKLELTDQQKILADVSASDGINATDALLILQYSVEKIDGFPVQNVAEDPYTTIPALQGVKGYKTPVSTVEIDEDFNTLTQCNANYNGKYDLDLDCYLAYVYGKNPSIGEASFHNVWRSKKTTYHNDTSFGIMMAFNRDNGEYVVDGTRGMKDVQTTKEGEHLLHSQMTYNIYYMVPTRHYMEYKWEAVDSYLKQGGVDVVALEEPEMWNKAGYSDGFKEEYEAYYGEEWQDPETSAEAMWKNQFFKAYINKAGLEYLTGKIKENYPDVTVLIAAHSNFSYNRHGISTGMHMYATIPTVDGFIGQTWSDDANMSMTYAGQNVNDVFMSSLYAYNSYGEALQEGQSLYLLQDPASDVAGTLEEQLMLNRWKETVVAAMMQNDSTSFQSTIWPQRAFEIASDEYKIMQLNVNKMYEEFDTLSGANYSGTPGIAIGMSDSMGWHQGKTNMPTVDAQRSLTGMFVALQQNGVLADTVYLDQADEVLKQQLQEVRLLILPYDVVKPMNANANKVISDWVKAGGRILFVGGNDAFSNMSIEWWGEQGTSPMKDLLQHLGLNEVGLAAGVVKENTVPAWDYGTTDATCALDSTYASYTINFAGNGFDTVMKAGDYTVGISATVGDGKAVFVGLPSAYYASSAATEQTFVQLVDLALSGSDTQYTPGVAFVSQRGNYFAYYSPVEELKIAADKIYVDLFSPTLSLVTGESVLPAKTAGLYYDVTEAANAITPKFGFIGATEIEPRVETAAKTECTLAYPSDSKASVVIFGNGKYPQWVEAYQGTVQRKVEVVWDEQTGALTVTIPNRNVAKNIVLTVTWGNQPVDSFY